MTLGMTVDQLSNDRAVPHNLTGFSNPKNWGLGGIMAALKLAAMVDSRGQALMKPPYFISWVHVLQAGIGPGSVQ